MNNLPTGVEKELSAREIFNRIVKGQVVRISNDPVLAKQLLNHLNVIKSREKRIFADLGLDFISSVISVVEIKSPPLKVINPDQEVDAPDYIELRGSEKVIAYEVKLIAPKKRRKYTAFVIDNEQPSPI
jgi:hypothetical protein